MLILRRKAGESIVLPGIEVVLTVVRVKGSTVRLGITAPPSLGIHREEIWDRRQAADLPGEPRTSPARDGTEPPAP